MRFLSVDVETANPDKAAICQVGVGVFEDGQLVDAWKSYINPEDYFHWRFIDIHGIDAKMVQESPVFPDVYDIIRYMFEDNIVVHHSPFDRQAFRKVFDKYSLDSFPVKWLDSVQVARRVWPEFSGTGGYNLAHLASRMGIRFQHHDALEDAIAAGKVVVNACQRLQCEVASFLRQQ